MENSEQLRQAADQEESDYKAWNLYAKANREERWEKFTALVPQLEKLKIVHSVETYPGRGVIIFNLSLENWRLGFYPKANKLHVQNLNQWHNKGDKELFKIIGYELPKII